VVLQLSCLIILIVGIRTGQKELTGRSILYILNKNIVEVIPLNVLIRDIAVVYLTYLRLYI